MSLTMFLVGFVVFAVYVALMVWNIIYSSKKQQEENYPDLKKEEEK